MYEGRRRAERPHHMRGPPRVVLDIDGREAGEQLLITDCLLMSAKIFRTCSLLAGNGYFLTPISRLWQPGEIRRKWIIASAQMRHLPKLEYLLMHTKKATSMYFTENQITSPLRCDSPRESKWSKNCAADPSNLATREDPQRQFARHLEGRQGSIGYDPVHEGCSKQPPP